MPATGDVIATSRPAIAFISVDFPTFGAPAITTTKPDRNRSAGLRAHERSVDPFHCAAGRNPDRFESQLGRVLNVREVELRLTAVIATLKSTPDSVTLTSQRSAGDTLGLSALRFRLRFDEIGQAFRFREVHLSVHKRSPSELSRFRRTQARNSR